MRSGLGLMHLLIIIMIGEEMPFKLKMETLWSLAHGMMMVGIQRQL